MSQAALPVREVLRGGWRDYLELTKPRVTLLVLITTATGFYLAAGSSLALGPLLHAIMGTGLVAAGTACLNQFMERERDGRMNRTARRPLPAGRLAPGAALVFGLLLVVSGTLYLALQVNLLTAAIGLGTCLLYLLAYTPLKTRTDLCTAVGAVPGALPPVMGWTAVTGRLDAEAWLLFGLLFLWQFPHFLSIAWLYREDYESGGFRMLPPEDASGRRTALRVVVASVLLLGFSAIPFWSGMSGPIYLAGALLLGLVFLRAGLLLARQGDRPAARSLLRASILYLPLLLALMVLDKV